LDDHWRTAAYLNLAYFYTYGFMALLGHINTIVTNPRLGWVAASRRSLQLKVKGDSTAETLRAQRKHRFRLFAAEAAKIADD
jgi:hypothetical protein